MALWLNVLELLFYAFMVWLAGHFVLFDIKLHQRKQAVLNLVGPLTDLGFNLSNLPSRRFSMPDTTHRDACVDTVRQAPSESKRARDML